MKQALLKTKSFFSNFTNNTKGTSAVEFALLLPIMISIYLGTVEISQALIAKNKVEVITESLADLVTRGETITQAQLQDMFQISTTTLSTDELTDFNIVVTAVRTEPDAGTGQPQTLVTWSESKTGENTHTPGSPFTELPANMAINFQTIIVTEMYFDHHSIYGYFIDGAQNMDRRFITKPRFSSDIPCTDCS